MEVVGCVYNVFKGSFFKVRTRACVKGLLEDQYPLSTAQKRSSIQKTLVGFWTLQSVLLEKVTSWEYGPLRDVPL